MKNKEIFCAEFEHEDRFLAVGVGDGTLCIYNLLTGKIAQTVTYQNPETNEMARLMCLKWRKMNYTSDTGAIRKQSMIMCAYSDGVINEYVSPVGKLSSSITEDNETYVLDIDPLEEKFCTAGKDFRVRLYDMETKELITKLIPVDSKEPGHAQWIFAMAYKEDDPNVVVTGGWDKTLQIHDIRKGGPVGYIFGPDLSSNAIDIHDNVIVTGSHRGRNPLQTFDIRKKELIQTLEWDYSGEVNESSYLNCVNISHSGDMIFGGGKGEELKFFELDDNGNYSMIGKQTGFKDSILWSSLANTSNDFVVGTADGAVKIFTK